MRNSVFVLACVLIISGVGPAQGDPPTLLLEWEIPGGQPMDVAADDFGNVYVAVRGNHSVQRYDENGNFLATWPHTCPTGIAVDSLGDVYVCGLCDQTIKVYHPDGSLVRSWSVPEPFGLTIDHNDRVIVVDFHAGKIREFTLEGQLLEEWGTKGTLPGEIYTPRGVAVDSNGNTFIAESGCDRVQKFDSEKEYVSHWDVGITTDPSDVEVDDSGNVYVAAIWLSWIKVFDNDGVFLYRFGETEDLNIPSGLGLDPAGNIFVADTYGHSVKKYGSAVPKLSCIGYEPPMDDGPVTVRGKARSLPFQAELFNAEGIEMTDGDLFKPPVIQVFFSSEFLPNPIDVSEDALPAGEANTGNQFVFVDDHRWQYTLSLANHTAPGTYTVNIISGESDEYVIDPTCEGIFVVD